MVGRNRDSYATGKRVYGENRYNGGAFGFAVKYSRRAFHVGQSIFGRGQIYMSNHLTDDQIND